MEIQKEIKGREDQNLTWGDIQKMKYTWRVAQELMRIIPPVFGSFRKVVKDTSFDGFNIPKGWQVVTYISDIFVKSYRIDLTYKLHFRYFGVHTIRIWTMISL